MCPVPKSIGEDEREHTISKLQPRRQRSQVCPVAASIDYFIFCTVHQYLFITETKREGRQ